jgi:hypothetical protein
MKYMNTWLFPCRKSLLLLQLRTRNNHVKHAEKCSAGPLGDGDGEADREAGSQADGRVLQKGESKMGWRHDPMSEDPVQYMVHNNFT